ncbi:MAG: sigma-54 interaction domain-containing protein [Acidobacteriaceae bacterium]
MAIFVHLSLVERKRLGVHMEQNRSFTDCLSPDSLPDDQVIFGSSSTMQELQKKASRVAGTSIPILIRGESGTGKEIIAKYLHLHSSVSTGPFVKVNCAAIPATLLESELFGYEKGSFTGALETKPGRVEMADKGTLFLDEIGELDIGLQTKLLHLLQDGHYCRIGGREDRHANIRILCATNCDLEKAIAAGSFREDLFYRIDVVSLHLPPLRERREQIVPLTQHFLNILGKRFGKHTTAIPQPTLDLLQQWNWPGNIRELENWVARYIILGSDDVLSNELNHRIAASAINHENRSIDLKKISREATHATEKAVILRSLQANQWNRRKTARELNISYRALLYKIREAGVPPKKRTPLENTSDNKTNLLSNL